MLKAINMGDFAQAEIIQGFGSRVCNSGKLAIGTTKSAVNLAAAIDFSVDGQLYSKAITADCFAHTDTTVQAANTTKYYALSIDAAGTGLITAGPAVPTASVTAQTNLEAVPAVPDANCLVGVIKIVTGATTFTPGTTLHDAANVTTTYYNVAFVPKAGIPA